MLWCGILNPILVQGPVRWRKLCSRAQGDGGAASNNKKKVVVVGSSWAGLGAAHHLCNQFLTRPMVLMMLASKGSGIRIETYFPWLINLDSNPSQPRQDLLSTLEKIYRLSFLYFKSFLSCQLL